VTLHGLKTLRQFRKRRGTAANWGSARARKKIKEKTDTPVGYIFDVNCFIFNRTSRKSRRKMAHFGATNGPFPPQNGSFVDQIRVCALPLRLRQLDKASSSLSVIQLTTLRVIWITFDLSLRAV
jgi:hypothetical protein